MGAEFTLEELVSLLNHTAIKTLVVEGNTDRIVYTGIENRTSFSVYPANGRNSLLELFRKKSLINNRLVFFLADRDFYLYSGIPEEFEGIIWTTGYSIENDIIKGASLRNFFRHDENKKFDQIFAFLCEWFAFIVQSHSTEGIEEVPCDVSVFSMWDNESNCPSALYIQKIGYSSPHPIYLDAVLEDPILKIRGKNVLDLFNFIFNQKERNPKYSKCQILDIGFSDPNADINKNIIPKLKSLLSN